MKRIKLKFIFAVAILSSILTSCWSDYSAGSIGTEYGINTDLETELLCDMIDSLYISDFEELSQEAQNKVRDWHRMDSTYVFLEYKDNSGVLLMFKPGNYISITRSFNLKNRVSNPNINLKYSKVIEEAYCKLKDTYSHEELFFWKNNRVWYTIKNQDTLLKYANEINCN